MRCGQQFKVIKSKEPFSSKPEWRRIELILPSQKEYVFIKVKRPDAVEDISSTVAIWIDKIIGVLPGSRYTLFYGRRELA